MNSNPKILVIEDQPQVSDMMVFLLKRAGCNPQAASAGNAGIKLAQQNDFDLILLDVDLPDMSGFEVCRSLKEDAHSCRTPIIFVTARFSQEDRRRGFEAGAADYIDKPFDVSHFVRRILFHLEAARKRASANSCGVH